MADWKDDLRPATFRGVPFKVRGHDLGFGRRNASFEFPLREESYSEDLGRAQRAYKVTGYVIGDDYMAQRNALMAALEQESIPGTLVHPYLGELTVRPGICQLHEDSREGRMATFEMNFIPAGASAAPRSTTDTASGVLTTADSVVAGLQTAFQAAWTISGVPGFVQALARGDVAAFGEAARSLLSVAGIDNSAIGPLIDALSMASTAGSLALGITGIFDAQAEAVSSRAAGSTQNDDTLESASRGDAAPSDPTFGAAGFANWGGSLTPIVATTAGTAAEATNRAALLTLVNGLAVAAVARIYADMDFASSNDAASARDQATAMIDAQATAAGDAGADGLYLSWMQLYAAVTRDLTERGKQLPRLLVYRTAARLPSLVLAQRLYGDASRAPELVARNAAAHPGFMPQTGEALAS